MKHEERLLTYLVENYRKSKKDNGDSKTNRRTQVNPEKIYKKYYANDGDFEEISQLNLMVLNLIEMGFITSDVETFGTQIKCIYLIDQKIQDIENYLSHKYGYVSKDMQLQKLEVLIEKYQNATPICKQECTTLAKCIEERKLPKNIDKLEDVLKALNFIETNDEDLYIREVSVKVYGDSKFFEEETIQLVCNLLRKHSNKALAEDELLDEILLDYHIAKEPQKLSMKGDAVITIAGKDIDISGFSEGIDFLVSDLVNIQSIKIRAPQFITIENRTSYLRYTAADVVTFYLGGYANRYQRDFIKLVFASNPEVKYKHFGDIDAGGFWIHHSLCASTGVAFSLYSMSVEELVNPEYKSCLHKLTDNDVIRLQELKAMDTYKDVVGYMLEHSVKLEQEIVSLELTKRR